MNSTYSKEESSYNNASVTGHSSGSQRPTSAQSGHSSHSSSSSSKHVKCIGRYVLTGNTLGKGNFARVEAAVHTLTRAKVAIKIIETDKIKEEYVKKNLLREAQLMRRLRHPNIIRLYETMKTNNLYCLVTEVAEGGELLSFVRNDFKERRLPEATTRPFIRQLTSALSYLHGHGIVHRDLKMENILLDKKKRHVKIVDFGLSNAQKPGALLQTHCGSPEYAAPELFIPGRQYGPEVDVWSLGVNMYAMLVGKLPFRSPRQGGRKRQKLLEQISAGITEHHEKEMAHLSQGAQDLICLLLQPDSTRRTLLEEVMHHLWVTKDGTQPLKQYEYVPPDPITQETIMELMNTVVGEPISQIRETVRRDRCDWLASIYNLLMDQPEGRTVLQRMRNHDDPSDQLTSAADEYQSTTEHLSLSQSLSQSQQSQEQNEQSDFTGILTRPTFTNKHHHHDSHHQHSRPRSIVNPAVMSSDGDIYNEHGGYESSTLPLTRSDKRRHHTEDHHVYRTVHPPSASHASMYRNHRLSIDFTSPRHHHGGGDSRRNKPFHEDPAHYHNSFVQPSSTPLPHYNTRESSHSRPHSRLSAPEPIPIPFNKSLYFKPSNHHHHQPTNHSHEVQMMVSPSETPPPINDPLLHEDVPGSATKRRPGSLKHKKSLSGSIDTQLDAAIHGSVPWKGKVQVGPYRRPSLESPPPIGWSSQTQFLPNQRNGGSGIKAPADIQSLMPQNQEGPHRLVDMRSSNSTEIKPELFVNSTANEPFITREGLDGFLSDTRDTMAKRKAHRSSSAKYPPHHHTLGLVNNHTPELTMSAKHMGDLEPINGLKLPPPATYYSREQLPSIDVLPNNNKDSPGYKRRSFSGILGKAFKKSGSGNRMDRNSLGEQNEVLSDI